jgi:mutator protein MutT
MRQRDCVGALIVRQRSILLGWRSASRTFFPNVWDVFGGHVEPGEQPEQTLVRELHEELGIYPTRWRRFETLILPLLGRSDELLRCQLYIVIEWNGTPVNQQPGEHAMIRWFPIEQAQLLQLADPGYPRIFARILPSENGDDHTGS